MIDLRSDTVTKPTPEMRRAMSEAPVGDDCYGDDPMVNELEDEVAAVLGKEAAVYMPSGTMANQVGVRAHTEPGEAIIVDQYAHIYLLQSGGPFALSGLQPRLMPGVRGVFMPEDVVAAIPGMHPFFPRYWMPRVRLVCIENTHNLGAGKVWPLERIEAVAAVCRTHGLKLHLDGARLWHASVATGVSEKDYAAPFDSVSVCFSKALGAPVGSALAGSRAFIERARRFRTLFGGNMRQAGIIAAGALYGLRHHRQRLHEDHEHAKLFAEGIADIPGIGVDPSTVETNIVRFRVLSTPAGDLATKLYARGLHLLASGGDVLRAVPNLNVTRAEILEAIDLVRQEMAAAPAKRTAA